MVWSCIGSLELFFCFLFYAAIAHGVLTFGCGPLFSAAAISFFLCSFTDYFTAICRYFMRKGDDGCFTAALLGAIFLLYFTCNAASNFVPLCLFSLFLSCTFHKEFCLQNLVYVSILGVFLTSIDLRFSSHDTLSARGSGVPRGIFFRCGVSCGLFSSCFSWCVVFTFLYLFGARDPYFLPYRFPYILGMSVLFGLWLQCSSVVKYLFWSVGALLFGVCLR